MQAEIDIQFSDPQFDIFSSQKARNLFHSGQGGGKTRVMGDISHNLIQNCPKAVGLIAANTYGQLSDSTLLEITKVWRDYGWTEYSKNNPDGYYVIDKRPPDHFTPHGHSFKSNNNKIFFRDGQVCMLASLDNYKAIEGRTIGWAMLDETSDTKEEAVKDVIIARLRQEMICINTNEEDKYLLPFVDPDYPDAGMVINPVYIFTKPAKEQWLTDYFEIDDFREEIESTIYSETDYFFKDYKNKRLVIASTFHNQDNLPDNYISDRLMELTPDKADLLIYGSPFGKSGVEYYANFNHGKHVGRVPYIEGLPLHLSFDFNVNPYMTGKVWQFNYLKNGKIQARCIKEYCLESPRNSVEDVCRAFDNEFGHLCNPGFYYYGDSTGRASLPIKDVKDLFKIIERELGHIIYSRSRRLLRSNPRHRSTGKGTIGRREFINSLFAGKHNVEILIDESCTNTAKDYEYVKEDANGAKLKEKSKINGVKCEKYGHCSDADDAVLCWIFGDYAKEKAA